VGPYVIGESGAIDRRYWELCLLAKLRDDLRSGDVWVEGSRRYADPQTYLIPEAEWPSLRQEACRLTGTASSGEEHLAACRAEMEGALGETSPRNARRIAGAVLAESVTTPVAKLIMTYRRTAGASMTGESCLCALILRYFVLGLCLLRCCFKNCLSSGRVICEPQPPQLRSKKCWA
jgi:hypothetical protein